MVSSDFSSMIIKLVKPVTILSMSSVPIHLSSSCKYSIHISAVSYDSINSAINHDLCKYQKTYINAKFTMHFTILRLSLLTAIPFTNIPLIFLRKGQELIKVVGINFLVYDYSRICIPVIDEHILQKNPLIKSKLRIYPFRYKDLT